MSWKLTGFKLAFHIIPIFKFEGFFLFKCYPTVQLPFQPHFTWLFFSFLFLIKKILEYNKPWYLLVCVIKCFNILYEYVIFSCDCATFLVVSDIIKTCCLNVLKTKKKLQNLHNYILQSLNKACVFYHYNYYALFLAYILLIL